MNDVLPAPTNFTSSYNPIEDFIRHEAELSQPLPIVLITGITAVSLLFLIGVAVMAHRKQKKIEKTD